MVKNPLADAGNAWVGSLVREDSTWFEATTTKPTGPRARALQQEATALRSLCTATRESPPSSDDPVQSKI